MTEQNGLERSSASERLRALLDERGVEWTEPNNEARSHTTYWTAGFLRCIAVEFNDGMVSIASSSDEITPEQAIEATLGRGECEILGYDDGYDEGCDGEMYQYADPRYFLSCEHEAYGSVAPKYCPECGRKVVGA